MFHSLNLLKEGHASNSSLSFRPYQLENVRRTVRKTVKEVSRSGCPHHQVALVQNGKRAPRQNLGVASGVVALVGGSFQT